MSSKSGGDMVSWIWVLLSVGYVAQSANSESVGSENISSLLDRFNKGESVRIMKEDALKLAKSWQSPASLIAAKLSQTPQAARYKERSCVINSYIYKIVKGNCKGLNLCAAKSRLFYVSTGCKFQEDLNAECSALQRRKTQRVGSCRGSCCVQSNSFWPQHPDCIQRRKF